MGERDPQTVVNGLLGKRKRSVESLASMSIAQMSDKDWLDLSAAESDIMDICICEELQRDSNFTTELRRRTLGL